MGAPWGSPDADPLGDIREFMREAGERPFAPFMVFAPPPLGCPGCGLALPDCHQRHAGSHCGQHDLKVCEWARG
jgi:hypothetical protein